jgi:bifunctional DNA-binding transcriptional regulator/antitoxin component of YhaV-PrlF toxin-antitoxin module
MDLTAREFIVTVGADNAFTIPEPVAERYGLEPGRRFVVVDRGTTDEFTVRVLPRSYAGQLAACFGQTTGENIEYVRREREDWG